MFRNDVPCSLVTAVLPTASANSAVEAVSARTGAGLLAWKARGTALHDHWWKRWLPPISPARTVLSAVVPRAEAGPLVDELIDVGRLHQQATGAVFSTPCEHGYFGTDYQPWQNARPAATAEVPAGELEVIHCIVNHAVADRVARAAIAAGAHGPVVYYCEGRGLRDRLGWLRITKEAEKEVLTVIVDQADVEDVFDAMAAAGQLHLPGRGFMYRLVVDRGLFNLPSRFSHHHYPANMQQIINAIDHLAGHTHWRDQSAVAVGSSGRGAGLGLLPKASVLEDQRCLTAIVNRDQLTPFMDLLLDSGAPGLNLNHARFAARDGGDEAEHLAGARVHEEYTVLRCVTDGEVIERLASAVDSSAPAAGVTDLCVTVSCAPRVATYVPGATDYRRSDLQVA